MPESVLLTGIILLKTIRKTAESLKFGPDWPMVWVMDDQFYYSTGKAAQERAWAVGFFQPSIVS